jgi:ATP-dependent RNA helicase DDX51/DBP6
MDLITKTDCLDLTSLEIVILDEADRLEADGSAQVWMHELEKAVYEDPVNNNNRGCTCASKETKSGRMSVAFGCGCSVMSYSYKTKAISKWLFSATLTKDPVLLQNMNLFHPILFSAASIPKTTQIQQQTSQKSEATVSVSTPVVPSGLTQKFIKTDEATKPLILWYLLQNLGYRRVLCFTSSVENAHRLFLLLKSVNEVTVGEFSSTLTPKQKKKSLAEFSWGKTDVLITSDAMARGLDIENINFVINYDLPRNETGYIHRIGRTARAGKAGTAITLVLEKQVKMFQTIVKKAYKWQGKPFAQLVEPMIIDPSELEPLVPAYENALSKLGKQVHVEKKKQKLLHLKRRLPRKS